MNIQPTILLVDGAHMLRRSMYQPAYRELSNSIGVPTGAIFGFLNSLKSAVNSLSCQSVVVCHEGGHSERRKSLYPDYKDKGEYSAELDIHGYTDMDYYYHQLSWIEKILEALGIPQIRVSGKEGDDVLFQVAHLLKGNKIIISEDRDFFTLVNENLSVFRPIKKEYVDISNFESITEYKSPQHYLYAKVLLGDGSDNIPGIAKGVGGKTVMDILNNIEDPKDVNPKNIIKEASQFTTKRHLKIAEAGVGPMIRNLDLIDISREPFNVFQLESIVESLSSPSSPNLQTVGKLLHYLEFSDNNINFIVNRLTQVANFPLANLVDRSYIKKVMLGQGGL